MCIYVSAFLCHSLFPPMLPAIPSPQPCGAEAGGCTFSIHTVDGRNPKQPPFGCIKPCTQWDKLPFPQLVSFPDFWTINRSTASIASADTNISYTRPWVRDHAGTCNVNQPRRGVQVLCASYCTRVLVQEATRTVFSRNLRYIFGFFIFV